MRHSSANTVGPILSLVLCSRNDEYMGNSLWRLRTVLEYTASKISVLGQSGEVEILVTDWGSDKPLRDVLDLSPDAAKLVSFVHVPGNVAERLQKDSPFAEVIALNAAARRARGRYIGRIDQDTLVGEGFLRTFSNGSKGTGTRDFPSTRSFCSRTRE